MPRSVRNGLLQTTGPLLALAAAGALALPAFAAGQSGLKPENVVIVVNADVPESVRLGNYYAQKRGIPADNICSIRATDKETISREDYTAAIEKPVRDFLTKRLGQMRVLVPEGELVLRLDKKEVLCLVTTWGVPLKIDGFIDTKEMFKSMAAGVDSELALLPEGGHILNGARPNPYYAQDAPFNAYLARQMLLVARLDGPSPQVVQRMIDDALWAEENGLQGRAYFDVRDISSGGYAEGDKWIRGAYQTIKAAGLPAYIDENPEIIPVEYPMPEAAFYLGWYSDQVSGPVSRADFRFARGAVAYHLHSFAAWTVRSATERWAGPILAHGAACTMGSVYEPFLQGSPQLDIFADRLAKGYTFAEAGYMSQRMLSWMAVFLGDPLYRPFARPVRAPAGPEPPPLVKRPPPPAPAPK